MLATVPDLIAVLDAQSGAALGTPQYKYGLRVLVLGITAAPQWTNTQRGLELGGPSAFGSVTSSRQTLPNADRITQLP